MRAHLWFAIGLACLAGACAERAAPAAKAASVERVQCDPGNTATDNVRALQRTTVLSASPLYSHVLSGKNNSEDRVTGARLVVRPPQGVSTETLTRLLQCHSAQALLGQVDLSRFSDDPYFLPDSWLDINVEPVDGNLTVVLRADSVSDGLQVLQRATAFADAHRGVADP